MKTLSRMTLADYPAAIATQQIKLVNLRKDLRICQEEQKRLIAAIKGKVANDSELKNDTQRKARESELMQSDEDLQLNQRILNELQDDIAVEEINLDLLVNQFSVLKIEVRERTASLMVQAA